MSNAATIQRAARHIQFATSGLLPQRPWSPCPMLSRRVPSATLRRS